MGNIAFDTHTHTWELNCSTQLKDNKLNQIKGETWKAKRKDHLWRSSFYLWDQLIMVCEMSTAVYTTVGSVAVWQISLKRFHCFHICLFFYSVALFFSPKALLRQILVQLFLFRNKKRNVQNINKQASWVFRSRKKNTTGASQTSLFQSKPKEWRFNVKKKWNEVDNIELDGEF